MERTAGESSTWNTALSPNAAGSDQRPLLPGSPVRKHGKKKYENYHFCDNQSTRRKSKYLNTKSKIYFLYFFCFFITCSGVVTVDWCSRVLPVPEHQVHAVSGAGSTADVTGKVGLATCNSGISFEQERESFTFNC